MDMLAIRLSPDMVIVLVVRVAWPFGPGYGLRKKAVIDSDRSLRRPSRNPDGRGNLNKALLTDAPSFGYN
jgi:hypothetical protein